MIGVRIPEVSRFLILTYLYYFMVITSSSHIASTMMLELVVKIRTSAGNEEEACHHMLPNLSKSNILRSYIIFIFIFICIYIYTYLHIDIHTCSISMFHETMGLVTRQARQTLELAGRAVAPGEFSCAGADLIGELLDFIAI